MPCGGPSRDSAYALADLLSDRIIENVLADADITPDGLPIRRDCEQQHDNFDELRVLIRKIVWHDHAASF